MSIVGHGIDIVEIARVQALLTEPGRPFLARCFRPEEQAEGVATPRPARFFAGRFATKEAVLKALGTGWARGAAWTDIAVAHDPSGRPLVVLHGATARLADERGIRAWHLSLSYAARYAVASAIATV